MGKQYKSLTDKDIEFIKIQKLFYLASSSDKEVNLSPKGYDSIRVLDNSTLVFMNYPGSGNRTHRDALNDGEFTLVFNSFEGDAKIIRLFCKATIVENSSEEFNTYLKIFGEKRELVRDFFEFHIYNDTLQEYKKNHFTPPNLKDI